MRYDIRNKIYETRYTKHDIRNKILSLISYLLFLVVFVSLTSPVAQAIVMSNPNYYLQTDLNTAGGVSKGSGNKLGISVGQTSPGLYTGGKTKVKAGFQYTDSSRPFSLRISTNVIDFGILSPTNPVTREQDVIISLGTATGYVLTGSENHPLSTLDTVYSIPDTTCDNGSCSEIIASAWITPLTYGFGYRCDNGTGTDCASDFTTANSYKQFSNEQKGEAKATIMSGSGTAPIRKARLTYKVNISNTQPAGEYSNFVTLLAVPSF